MDDEQQRVSLNLRVDLDKHAMLERMRNTGFGLAKTNRNRSDVYNEVLGYGLQTMAIKMEMGDRDFERLWRIINKIDVSKFNWEQWEKMLG